MMHDVSRRRALVGAAGAGVAASGVLSLLESACTPAKSAGLPVNVLSSQGTVTLTIQQLMSEKGYFQDFGVVPQTLAVKSGTNIIGPLLQGQADICVFAGFSQLLAAIEKGADLKIVAGARSST
jgi:ABC-type nitrate/sulfonate/bicarbonate transport system substrate-binding protein